MGRIDFGAAGGREGMGPIEFEFSKNGNRIAERGIEFITIKFIEGKEKMIH